MDGPKDKLDSVLNLTVIVTLSPNKSLSQEPPFLQVLGECPGEHTWSCRSRDLSACTAGLLCSQKLGPTNTVITMGRALS